MLEVSRRICAERNLLKRCLKVPGQALFDVAGMSLYLENSNGLSVR